MLVSPKPRETRGRSEFPGQGSLPVCPVERLPEVTLGRGRGSVCALQQKKLALDAQELCDVPPTFGSLGPVEGAVEGRKTTRNVAKTAERFGQLAKESIVTRVRGCAGELVERIAKNI